MLYTTFGWILLFVDYGLLSKITELPDFTSTEENEERVSYKGAQVWRATLRTAEDILQVRNLLNRGVIASLWSLSPSQAEFLVHNKNIASMCRSLDAKDINHSIVIKNVQKRIDAQRISKPDHWTQDSLRVGHRLTWDKYPSIEIIDEYMRYLSENFPSTTNITIIGNTLHLQPIKAIRISNGNPKNKAILIIAGAHAREWVSITSALYIADKITNSFDELPHYVKELDWHIVPLLNPEGYKYSYSKDRLWRKNRRRTNLCTGVDINRNFDVDWKLSGVLESSTCSEAYSGPNPFSEAESLALRKYMDKLHKKLVAFVDIHSYGQQIMYPWSAKNKKTNDVELHRNTAKGMAQAIYKENKNKYSIGTAFNLMYPAPGAALDWTYKIGVTHCYAIETRDKGAKGFLLPPSQILKTGKELYQGITYLASILQPNKRTYSWL